jgi:hypothetical protein
VKLKSKAIENFLKEAWSELEQPIAETQPPIGKPSDAEVAPTATNFSYRDLKKAAREITLLTAANLNNLYKQQNCSMIVEDAKFLDFYLGCNELIGRFKTVYSYESPEGPARTEGTSCVGWNGTKLRIY